MVIGFFRAMAELKRDADDASLCIDPSRVVDLVPQKYRRVDACVCFLRHALCCSLRTTYPLSLGFT
jgi:hypothetical protein